MIAAAGSGTPTLVSRCAYSATGRSGWPVWPLANAEEILGS
jgi:hypothetical protein